MSGPVVDVGITTGGRATYLAEAVSSALNQTLTDIRVTVGENGAGTDAVRDALEPFRADARFRHVVHGVDYGPTGNYIRAVAGDAPYLALLHDDDRWDPEFLERRVAFLEEHPTCGFVFARCFLIDGNGSYTNVWDDVLTPGVHPPEAFLPAMYEHCIVSPPTALVRRSAYDGIGGDFHELLFNDHEFWFRLGAKYDVGYLPAIDSAYRVHGNQATSDNRLRLGEHRIEFYEAVESLTAAVPDATRRRATAETHLHIAAEALDRGERATTLAELWRAAVTEPATVGSRRGRRRAGILVAATLLGPPGHALWRHRRESGARRRDAIGARRATAALRETGSAATEPPLFSVVVPAHNAARTIGETLDSILIQTCKRFEIIVVDDGSTDATADLAEQIVGDRGHVIRQAQQGVSAARNAGIEVAQAPYVSFLDADDLWLPAYLSTMLGALRADPEVDLLFTDAWVYDEAAQRIRRQELMAGRRPAGPLPDDPSAFLTLLLAGNVVYASATGSREALLEVGGFAEDLNHAEGYDLWLRLAAAGKRSAFVGGPLALWRLGSGNTRSLGERGAAASELDVLRRFIDREELDPRQAAVARASMQRLTALAAEPAPDDTAPPTLVERLTRATRLRRARTYRPTPPEVVGAFPELVGAVRADYSFIYG